MVEIIVWVEDLVDGGIRQRWTQVSIWLCHFLLTFAVAPEPPMFLVCVWAEEVSCWASLVPTIVTHFVTVDAFKVGAVVEACDRMLSRALLVVFLQQVEATTSVAFEGVLS